VDLGYHAQEAFYTDGWRALDQQVDAFVFIAVEKTDPFAFAIYELPPSIVEEGRARIRDALSVYAECKRTDQWPGYGAGVQELSFPRWAYTMIDAPTALDGEMAA
jgi:exodeoxyribonuclease VIII